MTFNFVWILGAGASAEGGCPVMANFFDVADSLYKRKLLGAFHQDYENVEFVRNYLRHSQTKVLFDVNNMEQVFSAIDMGITLNGLGELTLSKLHAAKDSFTRLTCKVLDESQKFYCTSYTLGRQLDMLGPQGYDQLAQFIKKTANLDTPYRHTVITFNYDVGFELACIARGILPLDSVTNSAMHDSNVDEQISDALAVPIHKLHGSIHWIKRKSSNNVAISTITDLKNSYYDKVSEVTNRISRLPKSHEIGPLGLSKHFETAESEPPLIVPPTDDKAGFRETIQPAWIGASRAIANADLLCVAGYSMPDTDSFFRHLFALSAANDHNIRRLYSLDKNQIASSRFGSLLGHPIKPNFYPSTGDFSSGISYIERMLESENWIPASKY
ncbi:MAG: hypothetical protein Phyf2KO_03270 [Phycisphaerales bacterium]